MSISVFDRGFAVTAIQAFPYSYRSPISDQGTAIPDVVDRLSRVGGRWLVQTDETQAVTAGRIAGRTGL